MQTSVTSPEVGAPSPFSFKGVYLKRHLQSQQRRQQQPRHTTYATHKTAAAERDDSSRTGPAEAAVQADDTTRRGELGVPASAA